jgi:hypothetical protein
LEYPRIGRQRVIVVHRQDDVEREQRPDRGKHDRNRQRQANQVELGEHKPDEGRVASEDGRHHG